MHFFIVCIQERIDDLEESEEEESASWWFHEEGHGLEKSSVIIISTTQVKDACVSCVRVPACQRVSSPQTMTYTIFFNSKT
jgi:hypothetical protein